MINIKWFLDKATVTGCYSAGLVRELDAHIENGTDNVFQIVDQIKALEDPKADRSLRTKPAQLFKGRWLRGLWHQHYTQAQFMLKNFQLHWTFNRLQRAIIESSGNREIFDVQACKDLSRRMVDGYLERGRAGELTSEWIVFAKQGDVAYYLTLGVHGDDEAIWHRCKACAAEFPELDVLREER